jgi:hypothetical protein
MKNIFVLFVQARHPGGSPDFATNKYSYAHIKYLLHLKDGSKMEIEISDPFESTKHLAMGRGAMLYELPVSNLSPIYMATFLPPPTTLMALKLSQLSLSHNWRKSARDIVYMLGCFQKGLKGIMEDPLSVDPLAEGGPNLKELIDLRSRENVALTYTLQNTSPVCIKYGSDDPRLMKSAESLKTVFEWINSKRSEELILPSIIVESASLDGDDVFSTPFLPAKFSRAKFNSLSVSSQRRVLLEIVLTIGVHYFVLSDAILHDVRSGDESSIVKAAEEAYLNALEMIFTRRIPKIRLPSQMLSFTPENYAFVQDMPEFKRWARAMSMCARPGNQGEDPEYGTVAQEDEWSEVYNFSAAPPKITLPSVEDIAEMGIPINDPLCDLILFEFSHVAMVPPIMSTLVELYAAEVEAKPQSPVEIPLDCWRIIVRDFTPDHYTALRLSECSRGFHRLVFGKKESDSVAIDVAVDRADDELSFYLWKRLYDTFCADERMLRWQVTHLNAFKQKMASNLAKRAAVGQIYSCPHCGEYHRMITAEAWGYLTTREYDQYFCPCPSCHDLTGSWNGCKYHTLYVGQAK